MLYACLKSEMNEIKSSASLLLAAANEPTTQTSQTISASCFLTAPLCGQWSRNNFYRATQQAE